MYFHILRVGEVRQILSQRYALLHILIKQFQYYTWKTVQTLYKVLRYQFMMDHL